MVLKGLWEELLFPFKAPWGGLSLSRPARDVGSCPILFARMVAR